MTGVFQVLTAIAAVAGGLGVAFAIFTSAKVQSTLLLYKEENAAQGKRITTLENEQRVAAEKLIAIRRENDMLRDLATGRSAMETLILNLAHGEAARSHEHQVMTEMLAEVRSHCIDLTRGRAEQG